LGAINIEEAFGANLIEVAITTGKFEHTVLQSYADQHQRQQNHP
jgi:hypothetical protein